MVSRLELFPLWRQEIEARKQLRTCGRPLGRELGVQEKQVVVPLHSVPQAAYPAEWVQVLRAALVGGL